MSDLRARIFNAKDGREELLQIPEWGVEVLVRVMTGRERAQFTQAFTRPDGTADLLKGYPDLAIRTCYDPQTGKKGDDGEWIEPPERIFMPTDRDALLEKSGVALDRIAEAAMRINGLTPESQAVAASTLPTAPNGASTSSSSSPASVDAP